LLVSPITPEAVDRRVARRADDPGGGIVRQTVSRPALDRGREGLLDGVFGEIEVAEDPDQRGDRPPRLAPEQAVDS
jgi:hypothetical protein